MIVERRLLPHVDWPFVGVLMVLVGLGLAMIYSTTWSVQTHSVGKQFWTQFSAVGLSAVVFGFCLMIDYRTLTQRSLLLYGGLVLSLVYVGVFGLVRGGSRRWIPMGLLNLQPSEFARLVLALVLAAYFGEGRRSARSAREFLAGALFLIVPFALIVRQPDIGTALTLVPVYVGIAYLAGVRLRWLVIAALVFAVASPVIWHYGLKPYQRTRLLMFVNPQTDARGAGYQQIQAQVAVGSGGLLGKGFRGGTQGANGFLPVAYNDFVFAVLAEEHGFVGVVVALGLYLFVIVRSLDAAKLAKDRVGAYLVMGIISGFTFQVLYNITMNAGFAPVKGLTLPLMSYGGSSLMATLAGFGLILNVRMRRFTN
jgi:rod shape determining protein RodA